MQSPFRDANEIEWVDDQVVCATHSAHGNVGGFVHGGLITTMLDSAMGGTVIKRLPEGRTAVTSTLTVSFLEPARLGDVLVAEATVNRIGRTLAYVDGHLFRRGDPTLIATATGVFALVDTGPRRDEPNE